MTTDYYENSSWTYRTEDSNFLVVEVINDTSPLINILIASGMDIMVVNIRNEIESGSDIGQLLSVTQGMGYLGGAVPDGSRVLRYLNPSASFDALIMVLKATPATGFRYG